MYEFITHTWNTVKGECPHDCSYCYMKRWGKQNPVRLDAKELKTDLGSGNFIFVGSSCDMWANDIPNEWIIDTLTHCAKYPDNKYLFQSKNPKAFIGYAVFITAIKDISLCTTIETNRWYDSIMNNSPHPQNRALAMSLIPIKEKYVTIEPLIDFDLISFVEMIKRCEPLQVNLGADSGRNGLPEPSKEKVLQLIDELQKFTTIHNKSNLKRILETNIRNEIKN